MKREENKYNDCISRQAVLELLQNEYIEISITDAGRQEVTFAEINVDALKALPAVKPGIMDNDGENSLMLCRENYKAQMESLGYDASGNPLD